MLLRLLAITVIVFLSARCDNTIITEQSSEVTESTIFSENLDTTIVAATTTEAHDQNEEHIFKAQRSKLDNNHTIENNKTLVKNVKETDDKEVKETGDKEVNSTSTSTTSTTYTTSTTTTTTTTTTTSTPSTTSSTKTKTTTSTTSTTSTPSSSTTVANTTTLETDKNWKPSIFKSFNLNYLYLLLLAIPLVGIVIGAHYYCKRKKKKEGYTDPNLRTNKTRRFSTPSWVFSEPDFADEEVITLEEEKK